MRGHVWLADGEVPLGDCHKPTFVPTVVPELSIEVRLSRGIELVGRTIGSVENPLGSRVGLSGLNRFVGKRVRAILDTSTLPSALVIAISLEIRALGVGGLLDLGKGPSLLLGVLGIGSDVGGNSANHQKWYQPRPCRTAYQRAGKCRRSRRQHP